MQVGTKSLLVGAHQFCLHPLTVVIAWRALYGKWPTWRELVCIIVHDFGYWGCKSMDGEDGCRHPLKGAWMVTGWFDQYDSPANYYQLCLYHSRHWAAALQKPVSRLYYADKLSFSYIPWWVYVPLTLLSGELWEYRQQTAAAGITYPGCAHREWHAVVRKGMIALSKDPTAVPYLHHTGGKEHGIHLSR